MFRHCDDNFDNHEPEYLRWILKIMHDRSYFIPWGLWYNCILTSCGIFSINRMTRMTIEISNSHLTAKAEGRESVMAAEQLAERMPGSPKTPKEALGIQTGPTEGTEGPKVCKYYQYWAIWIPREF